MNAGVRISPRRIAMRPARALPSVASTVKVKRGASEAIDEGEPGQRVGGNRAQRRIAVIVNGVRKARGQVVADLGLEAGRGEDAGVVRIDDDRRRASTVGDEVGVLGKL